MFMLAVELQMKGVLSKKISGEKRIQTNRFMPPQNSAGQGGVESGQQMFIEGCWNYKFGKVLEAGIRVPWMRRNGCEKQTMRAG
jgi:hypothetical protein